MDFSTSESEEEAEMKEYEDEGEEEEGEEEEEEEEEEKAMVGSEEEGSDYPSDLDPDELVESIEEDDIDLSGRVMLFHLAYPDGYPYCVESLAFEWTEVAAHLTVEKIREYDCHAFWKDTTLVELDEWIEDSDDTEYSNFS
ncbi:predicted protein [Sclerotinia sclerotiorum 1980 UF-70]|uniref:Uncharacterized protein n=1 Tax=Sclerotinia sclerotiorum (strain ATCC 18683 / 1980 / Ss-1) TaxID=665079 RepID=A7E573_SCLS1|nr:predicted protein [Sclerotinia sclerotiorum 1980 UF-70]EDN91045.1 predicted protein [Sclerotinia sclerotiorum 1980 UF-70]